MMTVGEVIAKLSILPIDDYVYVLANRGGITPIEEADDIRMATELRYVIIEV